MYQKKLAERRLTVRNKKIHKYLAWLLVFVVVFSMGYGGNFANVMAKSSNKTATIKSVSLKIGNKRVTKKTYKMKKGEKKKIKVSVSPNKGRKNIKFTTSNKKVVSVSKSGGITAKKAGTAKIIVTVKSRETGRAARGRVPVKKSTWVKINVAKADTSNVDDETNNTTTGTQDNQDPIGNKKSIVVYFSCTDNTKTVAEYIKDSTHSDIYRIEAAEPYTYADLNYNNADSRTSKEQNDATARPAIAGNLPNLNDYEIVYLGYPIWWEQAPKIMYTFVEGYDLSGKIVIPFCTSGGSEIGTSATNLQGVARGNATWIVGQRFTGNSSKADIDKWINELDLSATTNATGIAVTPTPENSIQAPQTTTPLGTTEEPSATVTPGIAVTPETSLVPGNPVPDTPNTPEPDTIPDVQPPVKENGKSLIVYFSRTGTTEAVAEEIQRLTGSDLMELKTVVPYPASYSDCLAQAQEERANNARPELFTTISNMSDYDTVYVGYPIWCYTAPMAIFTFLESYDFTGKTVIPFCTSGSTSITESVSEIRAVCTSANVLDGFRAGNSETVEDWLIRIGQIGKQSTMITGNTLVAYFSLSENTTSSKEEQSSGLDAITSASVVTDGEDIYGNTEYIARMIQNKTGGTLYQIQTKESYSTDFDEVVDQNHTEMNESHLPELLDNGLDVSQYDIVFIGYPVWSSTIPRTIHSFLNRYDLSGKTVIPFCTHNGYGSGNSYRTIADLCPNAINLDGLAVEATDIRNAESRVETWLNELKLSFDNHRGITVKTGDITLDGVLYDTDLAKEISENFPLTVTLGGYGGREYYGSLPRKPQTTATGQYSFENGDITYCAQNNTIAIFYAQTSRPNLSMEVVPIGKVTSDLSVFNTLPSRAEFTFAVK